jgi:hypothetical protein
MGRRPWLYPTQIESYQALYGDERIRSISKDGKYLPTSIGQALANKNPLDENLPDKVSFYGFALKLSRRSLRNRLCCRDVTGDEIFPAQSNIYL